MLARALWTALFSLLVWIPVGRGQAWVFRGDLQDRALFSVSALDVAADSPARTASSHQTRVAVAGHRPPAPAVPVAENDGQVAAASAATFNFGRREDYPGDRTWRGFLVERLCFPHDATAPPSIQS